MKRAAIIALLILASVPFLAVVGKLPPVGSVDNPTYTHVVPRYLEDAPEEAGTENVVTGIILNYRGFDTNGEVTVIFTAGVAVLGILMLSVAEKHDTSRLYRNEGTAPVSEVVLFVVRTLAPFIIVFSFYMIWFGHRTPGGGFQGGTIIGALLIALSIVLGQERVQSLMPPVVRPWLQGSAVLAFTLVGVLGAVFFGAYLAFPLEESLAWLRTAWLTFIEFGIGLGGAAIFASIFWAMGEQ